MISRLSIGPRTLLIYCNHSATAICWRSAILGTTNGVLRERVAKKPRVQTPDRPQRSQALSGRAAIRACAPPTSATPPPPPYRALRA